MNHSQKRAAVLCLFLAFELFLVIFMFYKSEPKYIDNIAKKTSLERYDMVVMKTYHYDEGQIDKFLVLQVDTTTNTAVAKEMDGFIGGSDRYYTLNLKTPNYRIVGQGTFYHKVNEYVGFNLMLITNVCLVILLVVLSVSTYNALARVLNYY